MISPLPRLLLLGGVLFAAGCAPKAAQPPEFASLDFDLDWRFARGDTPRALAPDFDDSAWRAVDLPHDWSIEGPFDRNNPSYSRGGWLPMGVGWYRKTFSLPEWTMAKKVLIYFGGVYRNSEVWINGHHLGLRPSGFASFFYDLTPYLKYPGDNVIAVRVDNSAQPGSRWYTGSGIYRDVRLLVRDRLSVPVWGTAVTTPVAESDRAAVQVASTVINDYDRPQTFLYRTTLLNSNGSAVTSAARKFCLAAGATGSCSLRLDLDHPRRWSPDSPYLYTVRTVLEQNGRVLYSQDTPTGIRQLEYSASRGFILNGEVTKIKGVCLHQDGGALGSAIYPATLEREFGIMKRMGANAIRTSHNPMSDDFLGLCDRLGFLVLDEAFDEWEVPKAPPDYEENGQRVLHVVKYYAADFDDWSTRDLTDFVLRDRNHPAVFMWSIGNEIAQTQDHSGVAIARTLAGIVQRYDSRPTTTACNGFPGPENPNLPEVVDQVDVYGFNYPKVGQIEADHRRWPDRKMIVTECTSAQPKIRRGEYDLSPDPVGARDDDGLVAGAGKGQPKYLAFDPGITVWREVLKNPNVMGMFIWTGVDYIGEVTPHPWPYRSSCYAPVDLGGFSKDGFYYYQSQWSGHPMVHLFPHWNWEGKEGVPITVGCFSNCATVDLALNGRSLGKRPINPTGLTVFQVPYEKGRLSAVGYSANGKRLAETAIVTAGPAAKIVLSHRPPELKADGRDLLYVECTVTDRDGNPVPAADPSLQFRVEGAATLLGLESGDPASHESYQADIRKAFNGKCVAIIRSSRTPGFATLSVSATGLEGAGLTLHAE